MNDCRLKKISNFISLKASENSGSTIIQTLIVLMDVQSENWFNEVNGSVGPDNLQSRQSWGHKNSDYLGSIELK